jgi:predicted nucleic acid-binding protein
MIALDTNVLIYACDKAEPARQQTALNLISSISGGVLPWQVACEFIAASRKLDPQGFTPADAWARLADFLELFPLVIPAGSSVLDRARHLHLTGNVAFWDAMIIAACLEAGVRILYSEDLPGGQIDDLSIINPFS